MPLYRILPESLSSEAQASTLDEAQTTLLILRYAAKSSLWSAALVQRPDDSEATVRTRLSVYHLETAPLIDYYQCKQILVNIDGDQPMDDVTRAIFLKIDQAS